MPDGRARHGSHPVGDAVGVDHAELEPAVVRASVLEHLDTAEEAPDIAEENAARCPLIMRLLELLPIPVIERRSPMALISILRPGTHIPPHHGMLNTRLICHIPLVVPEGCRLRVGAETRDVVEGQAMIFDDSFEHEAWNDGEAVRAVLLFEIWRPEISEDEKVALTAMFEAVTGYDAPTED